MNIVYICKRKHLKKMRKITIGEDGMESSNAVLYIVFNLLTILKNLIKNPQKPIVKKWI